MDWALLSAQWLRALRGRRSQRAASKRLGYGSNIFYRWETASCAPSASAAFRAAKHLGVDVDHSVFEFLSIPKRVPRDFPSITTIHGIRRLLALLRGGASFLELSRRTRFNRFVLSRWFRGLTEPKLPELFEIIDALTHRVLDFIAAFGDPEALPCVAEQWRAHVALRNAAFDAPWSHAVLRALELKAYEELAEHHPGWIAGRIGISPKEEERCLALLERARRIEKREGRWVVAEHGTMDTGQDPRRARELRRFWAEQALERFDRGKRGAFGYNLFTISDEDFNALKALYVQYFEAMRALIAKSKSGDRLVLFCAQLIELEGASKRFAAQDGH